MTMQDPVCMMEVDPRSATAMVVHRGHGYYFCSDTCRNKFNADPNIFIGKHFAPALCVGVMGSAGSDDAEWLRQHAFRLGKEIAHQGLTLITGACPGLPYECARGAWQLGGMSIGISPALSLDEHVHKYLSPVDAFDVLVYTGSGLMGREVTNIRSSDMVVVLGGRSGTLGEFAIAYDEGKLIGVLKGSGGIADQLPALVESIGKETGALMVYESEPERLLQRMLDAYRGGHFRKPNCFCNEQIAAAG